MPRQWRRSIGGVLRYDLGVASTASTTSTTSTLSGRGKSCSNFWERSPRKREDPCIFSAELVLSEKPAPLQRRVTAGGPVWPGRSVRAGSAQESAPGHTRVIPAAPPGQDHYLEVAARSGY